MTDTLTGQCHCGSVSFSIASPIAGVIACHCRDCQQMHGNYNAMAAVPRDALKTTGETLHWYQSSDKARRGFCTTCGGRLFKDNIGADRVMVSMGAFDQSTSLRIFRNIWTESIVFWYDLPPEEPPQFG